MSYYTILMVVRHWPDIAERAIKSIRKFSSARIIMVDDASPAESFEGYLKIASSFEDVALYGLTKQEQHGRALDFALSMASTPRVITCDHDVIVNSWQAFITLLDKSDESVGAVGKFQNNAATAVFGPYVHPFWALWNANALRKYHISFAGFGIKDLGKQWDFATAQFTCYRLQGLGLGSADKGVAVEPFEVIPVNLGDSITHAQVWQERGDTWKEKVR